MIHTYGYVVDKGKEAKGSFYYRECNSWVGSLKREGRMLYMCIPSNMLPKGSRNAKYVKSWSEFATNAGFKNKFIGSYGPKTFAALNASAKRAQESSPSTTMWYLIEFDYSDLLTGRHALAVWSVMRYLYSYDHDYNKIPPAAIMLKKKFPKWDHYECLMIAHYAANKYYSYYGIRPDITSLLLTKNQYLKELSKKEATSVHRSSTLHSKYSAYRHSNQYRRNLEMLFSKDKYEEIYNILKGKGNIAFRGLKGQQFKVLKGDAGIAKGTVIKGKIISVRKKVKDEISSLATGRDIYKNVVEKHLEFVKDNGKTRTIKVDRIKKL